MMLLLMVPFIIYLKATHIKAAGTAIKVLADKVASLGFGIKPMASTFHIHGPRPGAGDPFISATTFPKGNRLHDRNGHIGLFRGPFRRAFTQCRQRQGQARIWQRAKRCKNKNHPRRPKTQRQRRTATPNPAFLCVASCQKHGHCHPSRISCRVIGNRYGGNITRR